ncbi:MAG: DNA-binding domain-containing protein [Ahrensia sp.]
MVSVDAHTTQCPAHDTQRFASGLLNPSVATPQTVTTVDNGVADKRYNVYRNNATVSLISALADIFPATKKIIGEERFSLLARSYVRAHPPTSPLLFRYGDGFADFAGAFEPIAHLTYLKDVATAERLWLTAFHAADEPALTGELLSAIPPDMLGDVVFHRHAATATIVSDKAVFSIFAMNRDLMPLEAIDLDQPQAILITRPACDVVVTGIDTGAAAFIDAFGPGATLNDALAAAFAVDETFDLSAALGLVLQAGALRAPTITKTT